MDRILPRLYLGAFDDVPVCDPTPITHVFSLCERAPETFLPVTHHPIPDEAWLSPRIWRERLATLDALIINGEHVLVHCRLGVSRSPALVTAYLVYAHYFPTLFGALAYVSRHRECVNIHLETWKGVAEWDRERRCT